MYTWFIVLIRCQLLDQAMSDLKEASVSSDADRGKMGEAIDLALAKVDFVKVYLEDSEMPLPPDPSHLAPTSPPPTTPATRPKSLTQTSILIAASKVTPIPDPALKAAVDGEKASPSSAISSSTSGRASPVFSGPSDMSLTTSDEGRRVPKRPTAPLPTRSSIAQSNFSWMLEPDSPLSSSLQSSPPNSSSPFLKSSRRPNSGPGRDKGFLFGEDGGESSTAGSKMPVVTDVDAGFKLRTIRNSKDK
jgi:TBC1 domain family protein 5